MNAKAMLFVDNCQHQVPHFNGFLEEGMSTDDNIDFAGRKTGKRLLSRCLCPGLSGPQFLAREVRQAARSSPCVGAPEFQLAP